MDRQILAHMIGTRIRERRKTLKMTQKELSGEDFTKSYISQIELGQIVPSVLSLFILADRLRAPATYFIEENPSELKSPLEDLAVRIGVEPKKAVELLEALLREVR